MARRVKEDEEIVRMDPADDKTGEMKKSAIIVTGSAIAGAIIGDILYGAEYKQIWWARDADAPATDPASTIYKEGYFENQPGYYDRGGFLDKYFGIDLWKNDQGGRADDILARIDRNGWDIVAQPSVYDYSGAGGGALVGGVGGLGADSLRRYLKKRRDEEEEEPFEEEDEEE